MKTNTHVSPILKPTDMELSALLSEYKKEVKRLQKQNAKLEVRYQSYKAKVEASEKNRNKTFKKHGKSSLYLSPENDDLLKRCRRFDPDDDRTQPE